MSTDFGGPDPLFNAVIVISVLVGIVIAGAMLL